MNILKINENFKEFFKNELITAFKQKIRKKASRKQESYIANKWKLQHHSKTNKPKKLGRYFVIQIVRRNMSFISLNVQYAISNMSVKTRHYSALD